MKKCIAGSVKVSYMVRLLKGECSPCDKRGSNKHFRRMDTRTDEAPVRNNAQTISI